VHLHQASHQREADAESASRADALRVEPGEHLAPIVARTATK
jgi:hypothetical protein